MKKSIIASAVAAALMLTVDAFGDNSAGAPGMSGIPGKLLGWHKADKMRKAKDSAWVSGWKEGYAGVGGDIDNTTLDKQAQAAVLDSQVQLERTREFIDDVTPSLAELILDVLRIPSFAQSLILGEKVNETENAWLEGRKVGAEAAASNKELESFLEYMSPSIFGADTTEKIPDNAGHDSSEQQQEAARQSEAQRQAAGQATAPDPGGSDGGGGDSGG